MAASSEAAGSVSPEPDASEEALVVPSEVSVSATGSSVVVVSSVVDSDVEELKFVHVVLPQITPRDQTF